MIKSHNLYLVKIIGIFFAWRMILTIFLLIAIAVVSLGHQDRFLGGGNRNYTISPELFSWANFDGEHYLSIAIFGYKGLEQAFFPVYPMLIAIFSKPFSHDLFSSLISATFWGLIISNSSFLLSLIFLWKLIKIDYSEKIAFLTLIILIIFPTSFYFGALYSESLFLLFTILSFYNARKGRWWLAGLLGAIASATRIFGLLLFPALLFEAWQQKANFYEKIWLFIIPLGLGFYMLYQFLTVGDPLAFYRLQKLVGEQHQSGVTLLPQVYFRYIKMLTSVDVKNPIYQTIVLEFTVGVLFFLLPIYGLFKKIRYSYIFYALTGFLLPSIQGSFSSVPRYVIVLFPSFLALALFISGRSGLIRITLFIISFLTLFIETTLFLRGYWIA